jgi:hypothetical protein
MRLKPNHAPLITENPLSMRHFQEFFTSHSTQISANPTFLFAKQNVARGLHSTCTAGAHLAQVFVLLLLAEIVENC